MRKTTRFYFLRKALCIFLAAFLLTQPMAAVFAEPGETADKPGYTHIIAVIEREEKEPVILEASGPLYSVKAELDPEEVLPEDEDGSIALSFQAREITEGMPEYPDYLERLEDVLKKEDEEQEVKKARFFDLSLKKAGDSDFEPEHPVKLTISLDLPLTEDEEDTLQVVCFDEEEAVFAEAAGTVSPEMSSPQAGSEETTLTENEQDSASSDEETAAFMPGEFSFLTKDLSVVSMVAAGLPGENAGLMAAEGDPVQYVLNPLNSNGNWDIHTWAANRSQYQGLSIVHMDNIRDTVNRLVLEQPCNASGKAPVILPDHDLFFEGDRNITNGYKMRQQQASYGNYYYQWHLRGWYNIATGQYYDVSSGPLQIELDPELNNVFYADWRPENYPTVMPTQNVFPSSDPGNGNSYTPDTSSFVTTRMYDYSEFYNILGSDVSQNGIDSEGWYDPFPRKGLLFFDHTFFSKSGRVKDDRNDHWIVWKTGTLGNAFQRWDGTKFENVNQYYPEGNEDIFQRYPEDIRRLFPVTAPAPGMTSLGVDYLGEGNYLYVYNPETGYYQFDSDRMGAVYNQAEQRFYVSSDPRQHYLPRDATYYLATGFLPLNDWTQELRAHNGSTNYWFGLSSEIDFWLPDNVEVDPTGQREGNKIKGQNMVFEFSGDDDVWVFLDGELILDLGGIHKKVGGKVDFSTGQVIKSWYDSSDNFFVEEQPAYSEKLKKVLAGEHSLVIYYMERGAHASNCQITFNIIPRWEQEPPAVNTASVVKTWDEAYSRYENLLQETEITLNLWKVRNGNRVGDTPERTVVLPVDEGGEKNWTALFEHLDPAYDYEVEEVIPDEPYTYTSHVTSHHGMTYRYWSLAGISESYIGEQDILIGSNGNNPSGSSAPDVLLAVDDAGNVYSKTAEIMHGTVERTAVAADVIWTVEQVDDDEPTPTHNRHFFLRDAATGKYLAIRGSDGHLFLSANKYALNGNTEDRAAKFYLSPMGDLYDARSAYRLCVTPDGIRAVYEESAEGNIERLDRVFIYADQDISSKVFEYEIRNTPAFEILKLRKISEVLTSDKKEVLLAGAEFRLYRGEADSSGRFSDDQLLMTLVSDSDGILTSTDLQSDWILGADGKTLMLSYGVYTLKEIKAPNGFLIINEMIKLEVLPGRIVMTLGDETREMVLSEDPHTVSPEGTTAVDIYLFEAGITNRPGAELPETGGTGTRPYVLIGSLMTFLALFLLITGKLKGKVSKTDHAA